MSASTLLRGCLIGLVLVGIVFVQLTGAAGLGWVLPLYALTLLSPLLTPLREKLLYRGLWNAAVLGVFVLLVRHAGGNDLRFVLEDGLVLAALCQVHLLNNLRAEQRPDLLFLNSFLIAIVTGYLCQDLAYAIAFLFYAPLFVLALQLRCLHRPGGGLTGRSTLRVVRDGLLRSAWLLALTLAVFLLWPRDFQRQGFLVGRFDFSSPASASEIGFNDRLELRRGRRARASERVVMTVELRTGSPAAVPSLWRGATLAATNGREWWPLEADDMGVKLVDPEPWRREGGELQRGEPSAKAGPRLAVTLLGPQVDRLFAPLPTERLTLSGADSAARVVAAPDATLRLEQAQAARARVQYELALGAQPPGAAGGRTPAQLDVGLAPYAVIPDIERLEAARELAARLAARLPAEAEQHQLVDAFSDHLSTRYRYLAPGEDGAAGSLEEFLAGGSGGHCEFFAAALASMLRSRGVPCRVVTGYRSSEWDGAGRVLTFRARDAHSWVEVFDPTLGWYAADPVPLSSAQGGEGLWKDLQAAAGSLWARLTGFNAERRAGALTWLRAVPGRLLQQARSHPSTTAGLAAGLVLLAVLLRLRRRRSVPASVLDYRRVVRRLGLRLEPGETPRELLARARASDVPAQRLEALRSVTRDHERSRYAARGAARSTDLRE